MVADETIEQLLDDVRTWLRFHSDFQVRIDLWSIYGCYYIEVVYRNNPIWNDYGKSFVTRLENVKVFLFGRAEDYAAEVTG